ncbi:GNAT family N-acetyltransferase [Lysinibacillus sp. NPDC097287]|uniref:GNAT family N-acetyltransferase n=1 Tax=Lysinibacillus sp. NPDC097287 TaxID=3364144 RepID=UPI0037F7B9BE
MKICTLTKETIIDATTLFNAYRQFYGQQTNLKEAERFLTDRLTKKESIVFLAYHETVPVGFVQLYPMFSSVAMKKAFILNDLYVVEQARKQGVAQGLIEHCYEYCKQFDARYITLETSINNIQAQRLYEKVGMNVEDEVLHYSKYW